MSIMLALFTGAGIFFLYKKITFRIYIDDEKIIMGKKEIPWSETEKGITTRSLVEKGSGTSFISAINLVYRNEKNVRKTISIVPEKFEHGKALTNSIRKRIDLVKLQDL